MPPAIGAAIRVHTSDPVPVAHMIGIRPTNIVATVNLGRSRFAARATGAGRKRVPASDGVGESEG
jgi:hypothetical protein